MYADDATLLLPCCCYLAILASNTPTKQNKAINQAVPSTSKLRPANPQTETRLEYNQARNLQLSVTATTTPVASITTPVDLAANAIASTAFASPTSIPPTRPHAISYILIYATTLLIPHVFPVSRLYLGEYLA